MERTYFVYILASKRNGTLYVGMTGDLFTRILEHKSGIDCIFTEKYNVKTLVYFEEHRSASEAKTREQRIKKWKRIWKINLIEEMNPTWRDLADGWFTSEDFK